MSTSKTRDFTEGKILQPLLLFALPVLLALFLQAMYGAVDLMVVGKFGDAADISGVSTGSQIMQTITNVLASFAMGTTILLGTAHRTEERGGMREGDRRLPASLCRHRHRSFRPSRFVCTRGCTNHAGTCRGL